MGRDTGRHRCFARLQAVSGASASRRATSALAHRAAPTEPTAGSQTIRCAGEPHPQRRGETLPPRSPFQSATLTGASRLARRGGGRCFPCRSARSWSLPTLWRGSAHQRTPTASQSIGCVNVALGKRSVAVFESLRIVGEVSTCGAGMPGPPLAAFAGMPGWCRRGERRRRGATRPIPTWRVSIGRAPRRSTLRVLRSAPAAAR
jgi:hypothetical protein